LGTEINPIIYDSSELMGKKKKKEELILVLCISKFEKKGFVSSGLMGPTDQAM
jgi:hypothetical protein